LLKVALNTITLSMLNLLSMLPNFKI
jgi:hypothetical protein